MVIFIPNGSHDDQTRLPEDFDGVYEYLAKCGARPLTVDSRTLRQNKTIEPVSEGELTSVSMERVAASASAEE